MTYEEAKALMNDCMNELGKRFVLTQTTFKIKKIDKVYQTVSELNK